MKTKNWVIVALVLGAAWSRLIPHPPNFTAVGAMALFCGAVWGSAWGAILLPLCAMFLADLVLGMHPGIPYVYGAIAVNVLLAQYFLRKQSVIKVTALSLVGSLLFFLITNFGVWLGSGLYPHDFTGLEFCFLLAIPFFKNEVLADLLFSGVLFGAYAWWGHWYGERSAST